MCLFVVPKKRLNEFKEVYTARPRDLYMRFGKRESNMNFDSNDEPVRMSMNKLESIEYIQAYDKMQADLERNNSESSNSHHDESKDSHDVDAEDS